MDNKSTYGNILIVDDTPANLQVLVSLFRNAGYRTRAVPDGRNALRAVENEPPDIILLDINMPGMDCYEVCSELKSNPLWKNIPVIFISALSETFDKVKAFESGGVDYITKPVRIEEALARVKTHLSLRKYQVEMEKKNQELDQAMHELKNAQAQLIQSEKMASLGVLTAGIAHEINNPVSYILTSTIGLKNNIQTFQKLQQKFDEISREPQPVSFEPFLKFKEESQYEERLQELDLLVANIEKGVKQTAEIVKSLRLFTRLDEDDMKTVDIHENIDTTLLLLHNRYKDHIAVERLYDKLPLINCYPAKINQVFMNVLSNAIDAIDAKNQPGCMGTITIKTTKLSENNIPQVKIEVLDNGTGIREINLGKIFDPFFTTKAVGKGIGLGLSICRSIIEEHKGVLIVDSEEGSFTKFTIVLPINLN